MTQRTKASLKADVCAEIDRRQGDIIALGEAIAREPELGFREHATAARVAREFASLGITCREGLAITGVKGIVAGAGPGPTVGVLGELDAIGVPDHPDADARTGAVHACGHNAQIAAMVGVAMGLAGANAYSDLAGRVAFMAVPAEEYVELDYRLELRRQGRLEFIGGKPELIRLGEFDDVDMAMMIHLTSDPDYPRAGLAASSNGCVAKLIRYAGRAAHAGGAPHQGINALSAARIAMAAIDAQRETFRDDDSTRVHPIITRGGDVVNVVPADVRMETYVRGKTVEAIETADAKVDRCLRAGAMAVGATVHITTLPGSLPQANDPELGAIFRQQATDLYGPHQFTSGGHVGGGTEMGDLQHIMPALHPYHGGAAGAGHSRDYRIADQVVAFLGPAKLMAMTVIDLLGDGAEAGAGIIARSRPRMTKAQYLSFVRRMFRDEEYRG